MFDSLFKWLMARAVLRYIARRLGEASTWRSLFRLLTAAGIVIEPEKWQLIMGVGIAIAEITGVVMPDRSVRWSRRMREYAEPDDDLQDYGDAYDTSTPVPKGRADGFDDLRRWGSVD